MAELWLWSINTNRGLQCIQKGKLNTKRKFNLHLTFRQIVEFQFYMLSHL